MMTENRNTARGRPLLSNGAVNTQQQRAELEEKATAR
jgi:hypothetical protein